MIICHIRVITWQATISMQYMLKPKKQFSSDCALCKVHAEADETDEHQAHNATQHNQMTAL